MATKIRLARGGAKKRPYYRIIVADSSAARDGKFIEKIGSYDPMLPKGNENRIKFDVERAKHWLSLGAQPTDRVLYFFSQAGLVAKGPKQKPARKGKNAPAEEAAATDAA